jgi:hypothetical protein
MRTGPKKWLFATFLALLATMFSASSQATSVEKPERKKLSVMLLVDGTVRAVEKQPIDPQWIYHIIDENKSRHQERRNSYDLSLLHVEKWLKKDLKIKLDQIFDASGFNEIDPTWCQEIEKQALQKADSYIAANMAKNFDSWYNEARTKIVQEQQAGLINVAKPQTLQDYEKVESNSSDLKTDLLQRSAKAYSDPIFSENSEYLLNQIDEIIFEARRQYNGQRHIVMDSRGGGPKQITIDTIQLEIREEIELYRSLQKQPYKIFPSVKQSIVSKSQDIALKKFQSWADSMDIAIPENQIRTVIQSDIARHRNLLDSKQQLVRVFLPEIQTRVMSGYTKELTVNDEQRLKHFLKEQPAYSIQIEEVTEKSLSTFSSVRNTISNEQFVQLFPDLANGSWKLDEEAVQQRFNRDKTKDNRRIVDSLLSDTPLLEETESLVANTVQRLADKGDMALKQQMSLVTDYRKAVEKNTAILFQELPDNEMGTDTATNKLVTIASSQIEQTWSEMALSNVYPRLFNEVENQIRKEVKDLIPIEMKRREKDRKNEPKLNRMRTDNKASRDKENALTATKSDSAGEKIQKKQPRNGTGVASGDTRSKSSGKMGKTSSTIFIDLDIENEKIVIGTVTIDKTDSFIFTFPLGRENNKRFKGLVSQPVEKFEDRINTYFSAIHEDSPLRFIYCVTRVFHVRVPYGLVHELRERFRKAADRGTSKKLTLFWYDGFFLDKGSVEQSDIRKRSYRLLPGRF